VRKIGEEYVGVYVDPSNLDTFLALWEIDWDRRVATVVEDYEEWMPTEDEWTKVDDIVEYIESYSYKVVILHDDYIKFRTAVEVKVEKKERPILTLFRRIFLSK